MRATSLLVLLSCVSYPQLRAFQKQGIDRHSKDNMATVTAARAVFFRALSLPRLTLGGLCESNHSDTRSTRVGVSTEEGRKEERKNESPLT